MSTAATPRARSTLPASRRTRHRAPRSPYGWRLVLGDVRDLAAVGRQAKPPTPCSASVTRSASPPSMAAPHLRRLFSLPALQERDAVAVRRPAASARSAIRRGTRFACVLRRSARGASSARFSSFGVALDRDDPARSGAIGTRPVRDEAATSRVPAAAGRRPAVARRSRPRRTPDQAAHHFIHLSNHSVQIRMRASRSTGSVGLCPLRGNFIMRT